MIPRDRGRACDRVSPWLLGFEYQQYGVRKLQVEFGVFGVCLGPKLVLLMRNSGKSCGMLNRRNR
jgi:hypothetical protein